MDTFSFEAGNSMASRPVKLIQPIVLAVAEHQRERTVIRGVFGEAGSLWATVFGITLGDALTEVRGGGWYPGAGQWRPRRGMHPVPLGLEAWLVVCSQDFPRSHLLRRDYGPNELIQARFDAGAVDSYVRRAVADIGPVTGKGLSTALSRVFAVDVDE
jgi:hypothetical protein